VADHSKVGEELLVQVAPLTAVHRLVTDAGLDARDHLEFNRAGIKVLLAEEEPSAGSAGQR
jgi:DeoR/GlpR family transcriptional regulator of sugar metabolism